MNFRQYFKGLMKIYIFIDFVFKPKIRIKKNAYNITSGSEYSTLTRVIFGITRMVFFFVHKKYLLYKAIITLYIVDSICVTK